MMKKFLFREVVIFICLFLLMKIGLRLLIDWNDSLTHDYTLTDDKMKRDSIQDKQVQIWLWLFWLRLYFWGIVAIGFMYRLYAFYFRDQDF